MKLLPLLLLFSLVIVTVSSSNGCAPKKKKKTANVEIPPDSPIPTIPKPGDPNPIPEPSPIPSSTPTPTTPTPNNPIPISNPVPLDPRGVPIIPNTPVTTAPHIILKTGIVSVYRGGTLSSEICRDPNIHAYYIPCANSGSLYCWEPQCGYFVCQRWGFWP